MRLGTLRSDSSLWGLVMQIHSLELIWIEKLHNWAHRSKELFSPTNPLFKRQPNLATQAAGKASRLSKAPLQSLSQQVSTPTATCFFDKKHSSNKRYL